MDVLPLGAALPPAAKPPASTSGGGRVFHELLSDINPLQYIPVIGSIYRAITGDEGNLTMRFVASLGTSFALGGPIGVAITVGEKIAGIDPERAVLDVARHLFHLGHAEPTTTVSASLAARVPAEISGLAFALNTRALTADDFNNLELQRLNA